MHEANTALLHILVDYFGLLLYHHFKIGQGFSSDLKKKVFSYIISWITAQNVQKMQILLFFTLYIAGILNTVIDVFLTNTIIKNFIIIF